MKPKNKLVLTHWRRSDLLEIVDKINEVGDPRQVEEMRYTLKFTAKPKPSSARKFNLTIELPE